METFSKNNQLPVEGSENKRRDFLKKGLILGTLAGVSGISLVSSCKDEGEEEVTPKGPNSNQILPDMQKINALRRIIK